MTPPRDIHRTTLRAPATFRGTGLFTAAHATLTLAPADQPGQGLVFIRADVRSSPRIPATIDRLCTAPVHRAFDALPARCTTLAWEHDEAVRVATVEHVLSALVGMGVTDASIIIDAPEVPMLDGSALPFAQAIADVGVQTLSECIAPVILHHRLEIQSPGSSATITLEPADSPSYAFELDYADSPLPDRAAIAHQTASISFSGLTAPDYLTQIAPARTFCLASEARAMSAMGLFPHVDPRDMLVLDTTGPLHGPLRFPNEPARHKLLDLIGDLALVGRPIAAAITARRSGHALNHRAAVNLRPLPGV